MPQASVEYIWFEVVLSPSLKIFLKLLSQTVVADILLFTYANKVRNVSILVLLTDEDRIDEDDFARHRRTLNLVKCCRNICGSEVWGCSGCGADLQGFNGLRDRMRNKMLWLQIDRENWLIILKKFERSMRKSVRFESFSLELRVARQRDKLTSIKTKEIQSCRRESRTAESFLSSRIIRSIRSKLRRFESLLLRSWMISVFWSVTRWVDTDQCRFISSTGMALFSFY